jgi:hypothetical protein
MVNQKSDGFRSLTGFHGGLRRGTAAAAFGAVLVLSAGVPASNAAASDLPEDADGGTTAAAGLGATVDAAGLEAWAAAALSNERKLSSDHRDGGHRSGEPRPSDQPAPSVPPSLAPVVPSPTPDPSVTISARPAPTRAVAFRHGPLRAVAFRPGPLRSGSDVAGPVRAGSDVAGPHHSGAVISRAVAKLVRKFGACPDPVSESVLADSPVLPGNGVAIWNGSRNRRLVGTLNRHRRHVCRPDSWPGDRNRRIPVANRRQFPNRSHHRNPVRGRQPVRGDHGPVRRRRPAGTLGRGRRRRSLGLGTARGTQQHGNDQLALHERTGRECRHGRVTERNH